MKVWLLQDECFYSEQTKTVGIFTSLELLQNAMREVLHKKFIDHDYSSFGPFDQAKITFEVTDSTCVGLYYKTPSGAAVDAIYAEAHETDAVCSDALKAYRH